MGSKWTEDTLLVSKKSHEEMHCVFTTNLSISTKGPWPSDCYPISSEALKLPLDLSILLACSQVKLRC